jgi:hypothetical protein
MALMHTFSLLPESNQTYLVATKLWEENAIQQVDIHDDLLEYIGAYIHWIPTCWEHEPDKPRQGLDRATTNIINHTVAQIAADVFEAIADLFSCGPKQLVLTGGWTWIEGESKQDGEYDILKFDREEIVKQLRTVADFARRCIDGSHFILHHGL